MMFLFIHVQGLKVDMGQKWRTLTIIALKVLGFLADALFGKDDMCEVALGRILVILLQLTEI